MSQLELDPTMVRLARHVAQEVLAELAERPVVAKRWLDQRQAATYLGIGDRALETMRRERRGPRFSRATHAIIRYRIADLDRWLIDHMVEPEAAA